MSTITPTPVRTINLDPALHQIAHVLVWRASDGIVVSARDHDALSVADARILRDALTQLIDSASAGAVR